MEVDDAYTKVLLHFDGDDESAAITDEAGNAWAISNYDVPTGLTKIDQAYKKFGSASLRRGDGYEFLNLTGGMTTDMNPGAQDFTIDYWFLFHEQPYAGAEFCAFNSNTGNNSDDLDFSLRHNGSGLYEARLYCACSTGTSPGNLYTSHFSLTLDVWHHLEVCRSGNDYHIFLDGVLLNTWNKSDHTYNLIGADVISYGDAGEQWIDELRYSVGVARHTSNFTPPVAEYAPAPPADVEADLSIGTGVNAEFDGGISFADYLPANAGVKATFYGGIPLADFLPANAGVRADFASQGETFKNILGAAGIAADFDGFNWSDFLRLYRDRISIRYILTLSDGVLADIDIPISSFQGRFRSGDPTYLSVVVPGNDQYADIAARSEGDLILTMQYLVDGAVLHSEEICTVDLEDIRIDEGASSVSVSLSGHRTVTNTAKTTQLSGASYKAVYGGKIHYRCTPDLYLRPGDTVIVDDDTFTAGVISWTVDPSQQTMEVEEA